MKFLINFNYDEIDFMREIVNFKVIDKKMLLCKEMIRKKELEEVFSTINALLNLENLPQVVETEDYLFFYGSYSRKNLKIKDIFKFKNTIRKEIIYLFLILSKNRFNIMKFGRKFWGSNENRRTLKLDLREILNKMGIEYEEYMSAENPQNLIKSKIPRFELMKKNYLKSILLKRWKRVYLGIGIKQENIQIEIIEEELEIKNLKLIYEEVSNFYEKYGKLNSKNLKYDFFTYLILNLKDGEVNSRKRITSKGVKLKEEKNFKIFEETIRRIERSEQVKIYSYFKIKLYKLFLKQKKLNSEVFFEDYNLTEYETAEEILEYENKRIINMEKEGKKSNEKVRIILVCDLENSKINKNISNIKKIFAMMEVVEIVKFEEMSKRLLSHEEILSDKKNSEIEYILILSDSEIKNQIINYTEKPICFLKVSDVDENGKKKGKFRENAEFGKNLSKINKMMQEYKNNFLPEK